MDGNAESDRAMWNEGCARELRRLRPELDVCIAEALADELWRGEHDPSPAKAAAIECQALGESDRG
jgi:hypothetical protein